MSTVDLNRLVIRKKYFIPLQPSELESAILKELEASDPPIFSIKAWFVTERHKDFLLFCYTPRYSHVRDNLPSPVSREKANELAKEYDSLPDTFYEELRRMTGGEPVEISISVAKIENTGSVIDVELEPSCYYKIVQLDIIPKEYEIQHSYLTGERFLKVIFESGLSATTVSEKKLPIPKPAMELLINDSYIRQITERMEKMFEEATNEILIIGWIGTFFLSRFQELKQKGINVFVITGNAKDIRQDVMQKEKAKAFKELITIIGKSNISAKPEFHGRMLIVDNKALIGSADLDSYSLTGTRIEFATYTEDSAVVLNLRNYFRKLFSPLKETSQ